MAARRASRPATGSTWYCVVLRGTAWYCAVRTACCALRGAGSQAVRCQAVRAGPAAHEEMITLCAARPAGLTLPSAAAVPSCTAALRRTPVVVRSRDRLCSPAARRTSGDSPSVLLCVRTDGANGQTDTGACTMTHRRARQFAPCPQRRGDTRARLYTHHAHETQEKDSASARARTACGYTTFARFPRRWNASPRVLARRGGLSAQGSSNCDWPKGRGQLLPPRSSAAAAAGVVNATHLS